MPAFRRLTCARPWLGLGSLPEWVSSGPRYPPRNSSFRISRLQAESSGQQPAGPQQALEAAKWVPARLALFAVTMNPGRPAAFAGARIS